MLRENVNGTQSSPPFIRAPGAWHRARHAGRGVSRPDTWKVFKAPNSTASLKRGPAASQSSDEYLGWELLNVKEYSNWTSVSNNGTLAGDGYLRYSRGTALHHDLFFRARPTRWVMFPHACAFQMIGGRLLTRDRGCVSPPRIPSSSHLRADHLVPNHID